MKVIVSDNEFSSNIELKPETVEEMALLGRIAKNSRAEKPHLTLYLDKEPVMLVWMRKVSKAKQSDSVKPTDR